jgi:2-C-methyl-D-erythritol 4-phosphate cytidylyltransferase
MVVALPAAIVKHPPDWLGSLAGGRLSLVVGGETRAESVSAALEALEPICRIVLIHDAARPFVSRETIDAVIQVAADTGAVPGVPVSDTIKRVDSETREVVETVDREGLWRAQTPQGFPREMLEEAFRRGKTGGLCRFTDEAALVEAMGYPVRLVPDSTANIKVTTASDLAVAEFLANR